MPSREWKTLGVGLLAVALGVGVGNYVYDHSKTKKTNGDPRNKQPVPPVITPNEEPEQETEFAKALDRIKKWHKEEDESEEDEWEEEFPKEIVEAVNTIETTFFPDGKPTPEERYMRQNTSLKSFPKNISDCINKRTDYFVPLSWDRGEGDFVGKDSYMLHKVIFQYLCRMLCFVLDTDTKSTSWDKENGYAYYLAGHDRLTSSAEELPTKYTDLFRCMKEKHAVRAEYQSITSQVAKLIETLNSMYENAKENGNPLAKCGVFCGRSPRGIDN